MYNLEIPQLVISSLIIWFFLKFVIRRPNLKKILLLGFLSGIILSLRLMSFTLLLSLGLTLIFIALVGKISFKKMIILNLTLTLITLIIGGQFYWFNRANGAFGDKMEDMRPIPWWRRQPKSFYLDTFFRTAMRTPIRPNFPNRFIPIFYSDFWGDYWNYFPQRRFGLTINELRKDRTLITPERLRRLAWQNRINLLPSIIILLGFFHALFHLHPRRRIEETFLVTFFIITFMAFFYMNHKFANLYKGDTIKASYMLYALPVLIYFAVTFLQKLKKYFWLYRPVLLMIIISIIFNLEFNFF